MKNIYIFNKYFPSSFLLIFFFLLSSSIKASSIKFIDPNKISNKPMKKSAFSFHPLEVVFKYPNLVQNSNIKIIKKHLSNISIILGRLIYTKNFHPTLKYNKDLLGD